MIVKPTVIPAIRSAMKSSLLYLGSHSVTGSFLWRVFRVKQVSARLAKYALEPKFGSYSESVRFGFRFGDSTPCWAVIPLNVMLLNVFPENRMYTKTPSWAKDTDILPGCQRLKTQFQRQPKEFGWRRVTLMVARHLSFCKIKLLHPWCSLWQLCKIKNETS